MERVYHCFGPNQTIDAVIVLKNRHDLTQEELRYLRTWYNVMNKNRIPKPGEIVRIPILDKHKQHYTLVELGKARS